MLYPPINTISVFCDPSIKPSGKENRWIDILPKIHNLTKVNHLVTRFFNTLGCGDNFLYLLRKEK